MTCVFCRFGFDKAIQLIAYGFMTVIFLCLFTLVNACRYLFLIFGHVYVLHDERRLQENTFYREVWNIEISIAHMLQEIYSIFNKIFI